MYKTDFDHIIIVHFYNIYFVLHVCADIWLLMVFITTQAHPRVKAQYCPQISAIMS